MQSLVNTWASLDLNRRIILLGAIAITALGVAFLARSAAHPTMSLLYSGLEPSAAGDIISALDAQSVAYEIKGNSVYVDASQRDQLRLTLAAQGLPTNNPQGYELLDSLTGFGTTSQMFDAAYLRAKEGELARTIIANPNIKAARVHLAQSKTSSFRKSSNATASVSLRSSGASISNEAANSIRYLVAAAVAGMVPEQVAIIDADRGILLEAEGNGDLAKSANDRATLLKNNVQRLIQARTGTGNAVVEVNVETLSENEMIVERRFDPDGRVIVSSETTENSSNSRNQGGAGVTVASNLPTGDTESTERDSSTEDTNTREIVNYEISETKREIHKLAGSVKKISVAVLVDGERSIDDSGAEVWSPRSEEELGSLEELVKSAIGFDSSRGDAVTIRSMDLSQGALENSLEELAWISSRGFDYLGMAKIGVAALVVLSLGLFVIRPILLANSSTSNTVAQLDTSGEAGALTGEIASPSGENANQVAGQLTGANPTTLGSAQLAPPTDPVERLKSLIEERQEETIAVLRNWIEDPNQAAKS